MADQPAPRLAFWIHQVVEYLLGLLLISQAIQSEHPEVPVVLGVGVMVLAATADGPLAAFHVVPRRLHRVLDVVAIVAIAVATIVFRDDLGAVGVVFAAAVVVAMAGLVVRTSYAPKGGARPRRAPAPPATAPAPPRATAPASPPAEPVAASRPAPPTPATHAPPMAPATPTVSQPPTVPQPATAAQPPPAGAPPVPERATPASQRSKGEVYSRAAGRALGTGIRSYRGRKAAAPPPAPPPAQDETSTSPPDADDAGRPPLPPPSSP